MFSTFTIQLYDNQLIISIRFLIINPDGLIANVVSIVPLFVTLLSQYCCQQISLLFTIRLISIMNELYLFHAPEY